MEIKQKVFGLEDVRAIENRNRTEIRCVMKQQDIIGGTMTDAGFLADIENGVGENETVLIEPPYRVGDIIWVKETWAEKDGRYLYRAWPDYVPQPGLIPGQKWNPPMHMPREAARLFLKVVDVGIQKIQDISLEQIVMEGVWIPGCLLPRDEYAKRWDRSMSERKRKKFGWSQNPVVWIVRFELCDKPGGWNE